MADIISHAVVQSKSLMDQPVLDAEEVLGDLAPTVHALLYVNDTQLMDDDLRKRGKRFVKHAVARLLKYRKQDDVKPKHNDAFSVTTDSEPATWLTAFVLKTLCHSQQWGAFIDDKLVQSSFLWLLNQVNTFNGTLEERDWRLANDSLQYRIMLSAEVLISLMECGYSSDVQRVSAISRKRKNTENTDQLIGEASFFLEDWLPEAKLPMVLAKVTYAMTLFDKESEITQDAVKLLLAMMRRNKSNQTYWSTDASETNEPRKMPFWYRQGAKAASIEATAYALMVFLEPEHTGPNVDSIADWLVAQRNPNGAFIGAMDSTAAIQALSKYSRRKTKEGLGVNLLCDVKSGRHQVFKHSFKFTHKNATNSENVNDIPVGRVLEVTTKGQGLGQMQVNLEYNVPYDKNEKCTFNITLNVKQTQFRWLPNMENNPLCSNCDIGCPVENKTVVNSTTNAGRAVRTTPLPRFRLPIVRGPNRATDKLQVRPVARKSPSRPRRVRSVRNPYQASKKSICFQICLQHLEEGDSGPITVEIEMLTGHVPINGDLQRMKTVPGVRGVEFLENSETLLVHLSRIPSDSSKCVAFRAVDEMEVGRPTPSSVVIKEVGTPYAICTEKYEPVNDQQSLQVFCADQAHSNKGECRCYSGLCSVCPPRPPFTNDKIPGFSETKELACAADIGYQLQISGIKSGNQWVEIDAHVLSINKSGSHDILKEGDTIKMMSPSSCECPHRAYTPSMGSMSERFYLLSSDVSKLLDRYGNPNYRYLLDQHSRVLRVTEPRQNQHVSGNPAVNWDFLSQAFRRQDQC